jgi:hypothetical protein
MEPYVLCLPFSGSPVKKSRQAGSDPQAVQRPTGFQTPSSNSMTS